VPLFVWATVALLRRGDWEGWEAAGAVCFLATGFASAAYWFT
jgi:hypothetical protein